MFSLYIFKYATMKTQKVLLSHRCGGCTSAETRVGHLKGALFEEEKDPKKREGVKMYKRKEAGCCRCQDPICMNGKGLNCRGWGSYSPPPHPTLFGGTKGEP